MHFSFLTVVICLSLASVYSYGNDNNGWGNTGAFSQRQNAFGNSGSFPQGGQIASGNSGNFPQGGQKSWKRNGYEGNQGVGNVPPYAGPQGGNSFQKYGSNPQSQFKQGWNSNLNGNAWNGKNGAQNSFQSKPQGYGPNVGSEW